MDTGRGKFQTVEDGDGLAARMKALERQYPEHGGWFREGEVVEIRGSQFRIKSVKPTELRLKLLRRGVY